MSAGLTLHAAPASRGLQGSIRVPGDKSISHRSLMLGAIADGLTTVTGLLEGEDCLATAAAMSAMGARIRRLADDRYEIEGVGLHGLSEPRDVIDLGNSGTGMRLLCGLLAAQSFSTTLVGDESLSGRPMARVTDPLTRMGANIVTDQGCAPLQIRPANQLNGINYRMPLASAQLKSALILAGLYAVSPTTLIEPGPSRDHTERMLSAMGADITSEDGVITVNPASQLSALHIDVPADLSSAAFFMVAATIIPDSELKLQNVGLNPTRHGVIDILKAMGADIEIIEQRESGGEPVADLRVRHAQLSGIDLDPALVPLAIDEFPVLFVAAALAAGQTRFSGLAELRHKESDRIGVMVAGLKSLGASVQEGEDWVVIQRSDFQGGHIDSHGDHRIAMAFAVAAAMAKNAVSIARPQNIATSFPGFVELAVETGMNVAWSTGA